MEPTKDKPMRHGFTTGACATAATKAALTALIMQESQTESTIYIPAGFDVKFQLVQCDYTENEAIVGVIKDGGDDPDATHGALIQSTVRWRNESGVKIDGGIGVGRVTKPGLPVPVGEAAINPVPRQMIGNAVESLLAQYSVERGVEVIISVPAGEEIAKKTLNGRLGILGGISILGTRGIVVPFSTSAYMASIVRAIDVAYESGCRHVVLSTGGRSEKYAMEQYPDLPEEAFVEMGDFVGFSLKQCKRKGMHKVTLVGMMGKFSKFAQGHMMVHAKGNSVDFNFLADIARDAGATEEMIEYILGANTASQVGDYMESHPAFYEKLCETCCKVGLGAMSGGIEIETFLITLKGALLGRVTIDDTAN
ncbi:cobalt-precorrin-5B (C(1))-methyltransferase [Brevibacillus sp. SYSU BS000544]|uniref:cobalt-precorrin-5B (C(1))-methyltransferase n=1 Tax=Brevibacillus sp. SYSU BS000544 TaxID=3416443 RepID=UPI003CE498B8